MATENRTTPVIALVGNPNVGKSTVFNALTHLRQHTGNWPGKTVATAWGTFTYNAVTCTLVDLPGAYSLHPGSAEEEVTRNYLLSGEASVTLAVADATCLPRNLALVLQLLALGRPVVVCVNLLDEAAKKGIAINLIALQKRLGCPVVGTAARDGQGLENLKKVLVETANAARTAHPAYTGCAACTARTGHADCANCADCTDRAGCAMEPPSVSGCQGCPPRGGEDDMAQECAVLAQAQALAADVTVMDAETAHRRDRQLDRIFTSRATGIPAMLALLAGILWLTMAGANVPSECLSRLLFAGQEPLRNVFQAAGAPWWLTGAVVDGIYRTVAWVVSVMLPPMAIFFPLFTLLEDMGYLPRVAFNLDHFFHKAGAHGRQALTMCMGLGCNACGVMGCRILQSPRDRLLAILTNAFIPCNGRFPTLIALISLFLVTGTGLSASLGAAAVLMAAIVLAVAVTLGVSRLLSATVLKGEPSAFSLELPPYRMPQVGQVLIRSILDRTLFVLGRAVAVAAPAGLAIWCAANLQAGGVSILEHLAGFLDPAGRLLGMDGVILLGFLLGFPANEIVVPCILMGYLSTGSLMGYDSLAQLHSLLAANGWNAATALCALIFTLFHFPCGTTCLTIWRETKSLKWTALAIALPTAVGTGLCIAIHFLSLLV